MIRVSLSYKGIKFYSITGGQKDLFGGKMFIEVIFRSVHFQKTRWVEFQNAW